MQKNNKEKFESKQNKAENENPDDYLNFLNKKARQVTKKLKEIYQLEKSQNKSINPSQKEKISKKNQLENEKQQIESAKSWYLYFANENPTIFQRLSMAQNEISTLKEQVNFYSNKQLIEIGIQANLLEEPKLSNGKAEITTNILKSKLGISSIQDQNNNDEQESEQDSFLDNQYVEIDGSYIYSEESVWLDSDAEQQNDDWHFVGSNKQNKTKLSNQDNNDQSEMNQKDQIPNTTTYYKPKENQFKQKTKKYQKQNEEYQYQSKNNFNDNYYFDNQMSQQHEQIVEYRVKEMQEENEYENEQIGGYKNRRNNRYREQNYVPRRYKPRRYNYDY